MPDRQKEPSARHSSATADESPHVRGSTCKRRDKKRDPELLPGLF